ncbi:hypothetical protein RRG08_025789 [Elysia crispata]|uniref:Uncharacterized protein n=1 Tax=Elysia crispata TaxID=231223 RepID=A0AAE1CS96_9GAST|nr:hypothetical protein RRG08_025789 [Elysia crispata]
MRRSAACAWLWRFLRWPFLEVENRSFCQAVKAFWFSARSLVMASSFTLNQSWWTLFLEPSRDWALNCSHYWSRHQTGVRALLGSGPVLQQIVHGKRVFQLFCVEGCSGLFWSLLLVGNNERSEMDLARRWSVQHSAPRVALVFLKSLMSRMRQVA